MQNSFSNADLPKHFTDATRAILVDWLIQVHVSLTADGVSSPSKCVEGHVLIDFKNLPNAGNM